MSAIGLTAAQINMHHQAFWSRQSQLMMERMEDAAIREFACVLLQSEQDRHVPAINQMTIESALAEAAAAHRRFITARARQAGSSKKADPLQTIIERLVAEHPMISTAQLQAELTHDKYPRVIDDLDEDLIVFLARDGRTKEAPLSGLRDRIYRAKKKRRAR